MSNSTGVSSTSEPIVLKVLRLSRPLFVLQDTHNLGPLDATDAETSWEEGKALETDSFETVLSKFLTLPAAFGSVFLGTLKYLKLYLYAVSTDLCCVSVNSKQAKRSLRIFVSTMKACSQLLLDLK